jgi:amidohydrolase
MATSTISELLQNHVPDYAPLEKLYKKLHQNPELSDMEKETSATIFEELKDIDAALDVKRDIGGYGIAAVLRNGDGPVVMLRADFDALPIEEQTGLEYASTKRMKDAEGKERPVAHACGHDMHTTCLIGAGKLLASMKESWSGTLVLIFQPAEERGTGAQAMVDDGLYEKHNVPEPDIVLAGHVMPTRAGSLGTRPGFMANSADTLHVKLHGRGAHSSMPDRSVDPVVMAASTVMKLQTVVSRETEPHDSNVLTVASLHAGDSDNVIADDAEMAIDIRTSTQRSRKKMLSSLERIVRLESEASGAVSAPDFKFTRDYPATVNDSDAAKAVSASFAEHFGVGQHKFNPDMPPCGASEDFSILASAIGKPYCEIHAPLRGILLTFDRLLDLRWHRSSSLGRAGRARQIRWRHSYEPQRQICACDHADFISRPSQLRRCCTHLVQEGMISLKIL